MLFKKKEIQDEKPTLMRNRGSSIDTSDSELSNKEDSPPKDPLTLHYSSVDKPLYIKIEILIRYLQLWALEAIEILELEEEQ